MASCSGEDSAGGVESTPPVAPDPPAAVSDAPAAAETEEVAEAEPALIMATTTIWADVTRNVACGGLAEVESILPPLADPHDYEPSMSDRARLDQADIIVTNGLELEEGLEDILESVEADGTPVFTAGDYMTTLEFDAEMFGGHHDEEDEGEDHGDEDGDDDEDEDHADEDEDHADEDGDDDEDEDHADEDGDDEDEDHADEEDGHGSEDPHVWLDPVRVAQAVENLGPALVQLAGLDADRVAACTDAYLAELADLHREITESLAPVPAAQRKLVTNHDSLGYFADRYDFEVIATTLAEPSPADLEELAHVIEENGVPAIFAEALHGAGEASALAEQLDGVTIASLYTGALGEAGSGAETYVAMMRHNARTIAGTLGG
ncbi:MAG: zinc ABC transporter substrate-binding protein [Acidimicrobiia bacterium]|nr:zinc ABC transporter substrate-binding protein [Acidimicrobiia bacterium]